MTTGPLAGLRVIEMDAIGPVPMAGTLLADLGADIVRIDRIEASGNGVPVEPRFELMARGRTSLRLDLKVPADVALLLEAVGHADVLIEGFRPGVMERLGLGPEVCLARNPGLVYGRMTGWGQDGPLAQRAGHDLNYLALVGALAAIGGDKPAVPLNLVGDFGGGALYLAFGVMAALFERGRSGRGQVVDAAMVDGVASLTTMFWGLLAAGRWTEQRRANLLDGGAPFYDSYRTADGGWVAVGAIEPKFFAALAQALDLPGEAVQRQYDEAYWPVLRAMLEERFAAHGRDHWQALFADSDACVTPVLSFSEATRHPHALARGQFQSPGGIPQPAPAPRFSRTPAASLGVPTEPGLGGAQRLRAWGVAIGDR
jgi:alpha-methylacyl-CoA racemase